MTERQSTDNKRRLREGDKVQLRVLGHPITYNEIHAVLLGLCAGLVAGGLVASGLAYVGVSIVLALVGYSLIGYPLLRSCDHRDIEYIRIAQKLSERPTISIKTIRHEPWWFLPPHLVAYAVAWTLIPLL